MESQQLKLLYQTFDDVKHQNGVEFWYARDIAPLLGYARWENFENVLKKAKDAFSNANSTGLEEHFRDVTKSQKSTNQHGEVEVSIPDIKLTRYAAYLTAINGDPRKEQVAFAQAYFITKTREIEVLEKKMQEMERIDAREKLKVTEKEFASVMFSRGIDGAGMSVVKNSGDMALFGGRSTNQMKDRLGIEDKKKPLADFLPNVTLKAKDLATAMTTQNTKNNNLRGVEMIKNEHVKNNYGVRRALANSGILPENLPPSEDIKKIQSRHTQERKAMEKRQKTELSDAAKTRKKLGK